jgi:hypothetical protein
MMFLGAGLNSLPPATPVAGFLTSNSAAANAAALTAAINAATPGTGLVFTEGHFNVGNVPITKPLLFYGAGRTGTELENPAGELFTVDSVLGQGLGFMSLTLTSRGGHVINNTVNGTLSGAWFFDVSGNAFANGSSFIYSRGNLLDVSFSTLWVENVAGAGPMYDISSIGGANTNSWYRQRWTNLSSSPCVVITCPGSDNYNYDNNFRDINAELAGYGIIHMTGAQNCLIEGVRGYDQSTYYGTLFDFAKSTPGVECTNITLINSSRCAGNLASGVLDIDTHGGNRVVAINCDPINGVLQSAGGLTQIGRGRVIPEFP